MKRSAIALWATTLALALTAGPAAAAPGDQTITDSVGGAQVGAVQADAPVRVLSDGNNTSQGTTTGGEQTASDSLGTAQAGPVDVNAPVRVVSGLVGSRFQ